MLVSVIVPCYNQAQYLDECLQSVLDQTYQNWECIIVNDGSPDNTEQVAQKWVAKDQRFRYITKENGGVASARNRGIEEANGEWILPLDGDDKIAETYLELASEKFDGGFDVIYSQAEYFGHRKGKMPLPHYNPKQLLIENQIFCSSFFKRSSWKSIGGYDETMRDGYEDWEFWINLLDKKGHLNVFQIPAVGLYYRIKEKSRNTEAMNKNDLYIREKIYRKHIDFFFKNFSSFIELNKEVKVLKDRNNVLTKNINSRRYKIIDKILEWFGK